MQVETHDPSPKRNRPLERDVTQNPYFDPPLPSTDFNPHADTRVVTSLIERNQLFDQHIQTKVLFKEKEHQYALQDAKGMYTEEIISVSTASVLYDGKKKDMVITSNNADTIIAKFRNNLRSYLNGLITGRIFRPNTYHERFLAFEADHRSDLL